MITDIRLQHFRSYEDAAFEFTDGVNIIVGPNASGKTNLLEAILMVARGSSYRKGELIQFDQPWARLESHSLSEVRTVKLEMQHNTVKKSFELGGQQLSRMSRFKALPVVLFEPQHLRLLTAQPELRRDYIDDILEQTVAGYAKLRRDYRRIVLQRNTLLKNSNQRTKQQLFAWNVRLSELGAQIISERLKLITTLNKRIPPLYKKLSTTKTNTTISYVGTCSIDNYGTDLLHKLEANTELDYERGFTAYGPHRDDLRIELDDHPAQDIASRGETRTLLLALKIMELQILEEETGQKPLLLLDDVFSELDGARRQALTSFLRSYQTFITTTDADIVAHHFMDEATIILIQEP